MALATAQKLQDYYDHYRDSEITFSKEVTQILRLDPRQIYVKCNGNQWPCIINSTSLLLCRIIVGVKGGAYAMLSREEPGSVTVRFCFFDNDNNQITFFVNGRVQEISKYMDSSELSVVTIVFTQRPPDDLIEKLGTILEANQNAIRRKEERIVLDPETKRKLGLIKEENLIQIDNVPRHCILRDISFSGAKVIMMGVPKFVENKPALIQLHFDDPQEVILLRGSVVAALQVEGRQDLVSVSIKFDDASISYQYKIRINNYLVNLRKHILSSASQNEQRPKPAPAAKKPEKAVHADLPDL